MDCPALGGTGRVDWTGHTLGGTGHMDCPALGGTGLVLGGPSLGLN